MNTTHFLQFIKGLTLSLILLPMMSYAEVVRLDDSASPRYQVESLQVLTETGEPFEQAINPLFVQLHFGTIEYTLATSEWVGKRGNLYYVVPATVKGLLNPNALTLTWKGNGVIQDGSAHAGDRYLVWTGTLQQAWFSTSLQLVIQIRLSDLRLNPGENFGLEPYFELEVLP